MSDDAILDMIFNPGMDGVSLDMLEPQPAPKPATLDIEAGLLSQIRTLEAAAILLAEGKDLSGAVSKLDECISLCDRYASAFNNRAQVRQLLHATTPGSDSMSVEQKRAALAPALEDVNRALQLAENDPLVRRQALTQRGLIRRALEDDDAALEDYRAAAALGNNFAKKESVRLNPFAKLCNQYLQIAMEKQWSGMGEGADTAQKGADTACSSTAQATPAADTSK